MLPNLNPSSRCQAACREARTSAGLRARGCGCLEATVGQPVLRAGSAKGGHDARVSSAAGGGSAAESSQAMGELICELIAAAWVGED